MAANRPILADITMMVRPPGNPLAVKAFTEDERSTAEVYAREHGAEVEQLL